MTEENGSPQPSQPPKDWSPDYFPTSAKPIFRSVAMLVAIVAFLCLLTAWCSTETPEEQAKTQRKKEVKEALTDGLGDEDQPSDREEQDLELMLDRQVEDEETRDFLKEDPVGGVREQILRQQKDLEQQLE